MRRGLTMVELLLALALLSALTAAIVSWIQVAVTRSAELVEPARWRGGAEAALALVERDLLTGDLDARVRRVTVDSRGLAIRTRSAGSVVHEYRVDERTRELTRTARDTAGRTEIRPVLGLVEAWEYAIDEPKNLLTLRLTATNGSALERSFPLP